MSVYVEDVDVSLRGSDQKYNGDNKKEQLGQKKNKWCSEGFMLWHLMDAVF